MYCYNFLDYERIVARMNSKTTCEFEMSKNRICYHYLTLYDPGGGGGALKAPPTPIFCSHAFNFGAALLCVGDFSQKIV